MISQIQKGGTHARYVTREIGRDQYLDDTILHRLPKLKRVMVWGQISAFALAPLIFVNPTWGNARGNFTGDAYARHFVPSFRPFWLQTCLQFQHFMGYPEWSFLPEHDARQLFYPSIACF